MIEPVTIRSTSLRSSNSGCRLMRSIGYNMYFYSNNAHLLAYAFRAEYQQSKWLKRDESNIVYNVPVWDEGYILYFLCKFFDQALNQFLTLLLIWTLFPNLTFYLIARVFHRTFATGTTCQQRTLTPPDTWSCPTLGLASFLMLTPPSRHTTLFHICFKVDFRSRRWTTNFQCWYNVIVLNVGKTTHFQRCFNVRFQRWNNVRFQCWNNVRFQCWNNVRFQRGKVIFQRCVNVIFQRCFNVIFQRWNNVIFQRWFVLKKSNAFSTLKFDVVSTCICLLGNLSWTCLISYLSILSFEHASVLLFCLNLLGPAVYSFFHTNAGFAFLGRCSRCGGGLDERGESYELLPGGRQYPSGRRHRRVLHSAARGQIPNTTW